MGPVSAAPEIASLPFLNPRAHSGPGVDRALSNGGNLRPSEFQRDGDRSDASGSVIKGIGPGRVERAVQPAKLRSYNPLIEPARVTVWQDDQYGAHRRLPQRPRLPQAAG
jgi:hypothetical protein